MYNLRVLRTSLKILSAALLLGNAFAQDPAPATDSKQSQQPEVRVNYLNVCTPSDEEKAALTSALAKIPMRSGFQTDFEIARGRSTMSDPIALQALGASGAKVDKAEVSDWVRIRREFPEGNEFSTVQYSLSKDSKLVSETLAFRVREPQEILQISIQDNFASTTDLSVALGLNTPASHIKVERFGKSSVALARCERDQSAYEPLFRQASDIMAKYRAMLRVQQTVPADLARLSPPAKKKSAKKPATETPGTQKPQS